MLTCKGASRLLSERQERPLSARERLGLRVHLWMCVKCRRFEQQLELMRRAMHSLRQRVKADADGAELSDAARERIRRALGKP